MMNDPKLIEEIVSEVINQLSDNSQTTSKPLLFVRNADQDTLKKLKRKWKVASDFKGVEKAILFGVSQDTLAKGALGFTDDPDSKLLADLLLQGKQVTLIPEPMLEWLISTKEDLTPYHRHLVTYKEKLESFGVRFTALESFITLTESREKVPFEKLLTDKAVRDTEDDVLWIGKSAIITPLAHDTANKLGKTIKRME